VSLKDRLTRSKSGILSVQGDRPQMDKKRLFVSPWEAGE